MKLWISKNSEVTVREQIVTQIKLGIASGDLETNEKLPSIRELARRFGLHPNTVSAAYNDLAEQGLVEQRKGSGVYVAESAATGELEQTRLDEMLRAFIAAARSVGYAKDEINAAMKRSINADTGLLVVESDDGLRSILCREIGSALGREVNGISAEDLENIDPNFLRRYSHIAALPDEKEKLNGNVPPDIPCIFIRVNSVPQTMEGSRRPAENEIVAIVSDWGEFRAFAKLYLLAAGVHPDALMLRSTKDDDRQNGIASATVVICDSYAASFFPADERVRTFQLISDDSLKDLAAGIRRSE
jgi:GntR family transcriptional regulator